MDFNLTEEQRMIVDTTRAFVENEPYPHEAEVERTGELRRELYEELKAKAIEAGLYAANMPEEVGGAGLDTQTWVLYEKELGRANYALHWNCVARPSNILMACNEEQRERYTLPCVRGEKIDCMAMTEPGAGSDLRGMKATAVRDGDDWIINGTKHFISHADVADFVIVYAASGEEDTPRGKKKLITSFIVDMGTAGFTVRDGYRNVSRRRLHQLHTGIYDCRVPDAQRLGDIHKGFDVANDWLGATRLQVAATCLGRAERAFEHALQWSVDRTVRPADFQVPGRVVQARRHGTRSEGGKPAHHGSRLEIRPGHRERRRHGHGKAQGIGNAGLRGGRSHPDTRRHGGHGILEDGLWHIGQSVKAESILPAIYDGQGRHPNVRASR